MIEFSNKELNMLIVGLYEAIDRRNIWIATGKGHLTSEDNRLRFIDLREKVSRELAERETSNWGKNSRSEKNSDV